MINRLATGQRFPLYFAPSDDELLGHSTVCVGVKWGPVVTEKKRLFGSPQKVMQPVDLDLSCIIVRDDEDMPYDYLYNPDYDEKALATVNLPPGQLITADGSFRHSGDDVTGDLAGASKLDNEVITIDLNRLDERVQSVYFLLNNLGKEDFSEIPYACLRIYQGSARDVFAEYVSYEIEASPLHRGCRAVIMGKLEREANEHWRFTALGETNPDENVAATIFRVQRYLREQSS